MARDATARLYDVDEDSVVLKNITGKGKEYDSGTITFRADQGKFIDLDQLRESLWATRLSGGTRSGVLKLEVTAQGKVVKQGEQWILKFNNSDQYFVLVEDAQKDDAEKKSDSEKKDALERLQKAVGSGTKVTTVTGRLDGWTGRWPQFLNAKLPQPQRMFVMSFQ